MPERPTVEEEEDIPDGGGGGKKSTSNTTMRTIELEKTLFNIGNLLQMAYGRLGAVIIKENVSAGDGQPEIMIPGRKMDAIFMSVKINDFVILADILQEEINQFMNKILSIVHTTADKWSGSPNKTDNDRLLITWKLPETIEEGDNEKNEQRLEQRTEFADKALIAAVKIVSEIRRSSKLATYSHDPKIRDKFLPDKYKPKLTFGLHMGWAIEGAIGSADHKIDACYLSPQKTIADRVEELCHYYDMEILVTEDLYNLMSLKARNTLRKIDVIKMNECKDQKGIYTFDLCITDEIMQTPDEHSVGDLIKLQEFESINIESFKNKGVDYMFTLDSDIVGLQSHIHEFNPIFRQAFKTYISGDWNHAYDNIDRALELLDNDGPTRAMQRYMAYFRFQTHEEWNGFRDIDKKINIEELNQKFEEKEAKRELEEQ